MTIEGAGALAAFVVLPERGETTSDILHPEIDSKVVGYMRFARVVVGGIMSARHSAPRLSSALAGSPLMPLRRAPHRPDPAGVVGVRCAEVRLAFLMLEPYLSTSISMWQHEPTGSCSPMLPMSDKRVGDICVILDPCRRKSRNSSHCFRQTAGVLCAKRGAIVSTITPRSRGR